MVEAVCQFCMAWFDGTPKDPGKRRRGEILRFCSVACRNRHNTKQLRKQEPQRFLPDPDPASFIRECGACKKSFDATPPNPRYDKPRQYCSKACRDLGRGQKGRRRVAKECKHCGNTFEILRSWDKTKGKHTGQFCSHGCWVQYQRSNYTRRKSPEGAGQPRVNNQGYVVVWRPWFKFCNEARENGEQSTYARGRMLEHRMVMEELMGRRLHKWESVHHKDGDRQNNDPSNLELWIKTQPTGVRLADVADVYGAELVAARLRIRELEDQLSHRPT